ncbi:hypothetical protein Taro_010978 [Colocasia esculenta]|uniref:R13L1/DRL21-like LRR repeat region domain-containing protein n=1 Tax=Colocasia esculenta TaxID=4460 RepID=A0A843U4U9_COLES|nr:hypothetical protein [Colocasia esculenta]
MHATIRWQSTSLVSMADMFGSNLFISIHVTIGIFLISLENTYEPQSPRSCLLLQTSSGCQFRNIKRVDDMFARMKHSRVLVLNEIKFSKFPDSITHLKHRRYLSLTNIDITELSDAIGNLYHLQTLESTCYKKKFELSYWSWNFHLIFVTGADCVEYPEGIAKLTELQTVSYFNDHQHQGSAKLGELRDLNNIKGSLVIRVINQLTDVQEAKMACLEKKRKIQTLTLEGDIRGGPTPIDSDVLESLKPRPKLENLYIFMGTSPSSWLGHPSFSKLEKIELEGCQNWASLPPLGQLPSLIYLSIQSAKSTVKSIGHEFFSGGFPQLRTLQLKDMEN